MQRFETVDADGNTISTSKKPDETRTDELRKHLKKKLIPYCAESAQKLLCSEVAWPVILETCLALPGLVGADCLWQPYRLHSMLMLVSDLRFWQMMLLLFSKTLYVLQRRNLGPQRMIMFLRTSTLVEC